MQYGISGSERDGWNDVVRRGQRVGKSKKRKRGVIRKAISQRGEKGGLCVWCVCV